MLRVLFVALLLLILIAAVGFSIRTCSTSYQTSSLPQGYAALERAETGNAADT
jgi:hypothetical protein